MQRVYEGFQEIYEKHGVKVIGAWENADDTDETYLITAYRDKGPLRGGRRQDAGGPHIPKAI